MKKRSCFAWGAWAAAAAVLLALIATAAVLAFSYDGKCGGFVPGLAAAKPCTLTQYVLGNLMLLALIAWTEFWPFIITALALPLVVGHVLDRRRSNQ